MSGAGAVAGRLKTSFASSRLGTPTNTRRLRKEVERYLPDFLAQAPPQQQRREQAGGREHP